MSRYFVNAIAEYQYTLILNPMMGNTESGSQFGPFLTREAALAFHDGERVELYTDEGVNTFDGGTKRYSKTFRKGGPLEWFNPLMPAERETPGCFGHGVHEVLTNVTQVNRLYEAP
jgi:hypothetical protein